MVRVLWADAFSLDGGWHCAEELSEIAKNNDWIVADVGYLVHECDEYLLIAGKINENNLYGEVTKIPRTWTSIEYLEIKDRKAYKKKTIDIKKK